MNRARFWRRVHLWFGLATAVPMVVLAVSGVLWLHRDSLGLRSVKVERADPSPGGTGLRASAQPLSAAGWRDHAAAIDEALAQAERLWRKAPQLDRIELKHQPGLGVIVKVRAAKGEHVAPPEVVYSTVERAVVSLGAGPHWVERLHKGDLFFGPRWAFLWLDLSAAGMLIVVISGLWIWRIRPRAKPGVVQSAAAVERPIAPSIVAGDER